MSSLDGRVVAVAGAGGSLGPHVVARLKDAGATVAVTDRDEEKIAALGADDAQVVDLLDEGAARAWADGLTTRFGHVDGLAHLVGGWRGGTPIGEAPLEDWDLLHDLLIRTVQHTSRAFLPHLVASGRGRFVLVSSAQAQKPSSTNAAYGAAKAAAEAWTLALADELTESGGTANILVVNAIVTPEMRAANPDKAYKTFTDASDMADAIAFLVSDTAARMNGQRLALHG
jgi:NAD(P)-dependent dehydrogenase (short-subunit alcohol dehydrogenase family)